MRLWGLAVLGLLLLNTKAALAEKITIHCAGADYNRTPVERTYSIDFDQWIIYHWAKRAWFDLARPGSDTQVDQLRAQLGSDSFGFRNCGSCATAFSRQNGKWLSDNYTEGACSAIEWREPPSRAF